MEFAGVLNRNGSRRLKPPVHEHRLQDIELLAAVFDLATKPIQRGQKIRNGIGLQRGAVFGTAESRPGFKIELTRLQLRHAHQPPSQGIEPDNMGLKLTQTLGERVQMVFGMLRRVSKLLALSLQLLFIGLQRRVVHEFGTGGSELISGENERAKQQHQDTTKNQASSSAQMEILAPSRQPRQTDCFRP